MIKYLILRFANGGKFYSISLNSRIPKFRQDQLDVIYESKVKI